MSETNVQDKVEEIKTKTVGAVTTEAEDLRSSGEQIYDNNKNLINGIIGGIVVLVLGYFLYQNFYIKDKIAEANEAIWRGEQYFAVDSFRLALEGDGSDFEGFEIVAEDYGMTEAGNLANYYAGISALQLGRYETAIDHLEDFKTDDPLLAPIAFGARGDAYSELGQNDDAIKFYKKAYSYENELTSPIYMMKAGLLLELESKNDKALDLYKKIKSKYPNSEEGRNVVKYISKLELASK